jgi:hypothetical protein
MWLHPAIDDTNSTRWHHHRHWDTVLLTQSALEVSWRVRLDRTVRNASEEWLKLSAGKMDIGLMRSVIHEIDVKWLWLRSWRNIFETQLGADLLCQHRWNANKTLKMSCLRPPNYDRRWWRWGMRLEPLNHCISRLRHVVYSLQCITCQHLLFDTTTWTVGFVLTHQWSSLR